MHPILTLGAEFLFIYLAGFFVCLFLLLCLIIFSNLFDSWFYRKSSHALTWDVESRHSICKIGMSIAHFSLSVFWRTHPSGSRTKQGQPDPEHPVLFPKVVQNRDLKAAPSKLLGTYPHFQTNIIRAFWPFIPLSTKPGNGILLEL